MTYMYEVKEQIIFSPILEFDFDRWSLNTLTGQ